eukprot:GFYU01009580.1.p1 GENE.GFYU01009580.1~~GFYU01009580.1.p1  ORF type:complete len:434 (-),score=61.56 GFYU01009580.1:315-1616(-)
MRSTLRTIAIFFVLGLVVVHADTPRGLRQTNTVTSADQRSSSSTQNAVQMFVQGFNLLLKSPRELQATAASNNSTNTSDAKSDSDDGDWTHSHLITTIASLTLVALMCFLASMIRPIMFKQRVCCKSCPKGCQNLCKCLDPPPRHKRYPQRKPPKRHSRSKSSAPEFQLSPLKYFTGVGSKSVIGGLMSRGGKDSESVSASLRRDLPSSDSLQFMSNGSNGGNGHGSRGSHNVYHNKDSTLEPRSYPDLTEPPLPRPPTYPSVPSSYPGFTPTRGPGGGIGAMVREGSGEGVEEYGTQSVHTSDSGSVYSSSYQSTSALSSRATTRDTSPPKKRGRDTSPRRAGEPTTSSGASAGGGPASAPAGGFVTPSKQRQDRAPSQLRTPEDIQKAGRNYNFVKDKDKLRKMRHSAPAESGAPTGGRGTGGGGEGSSRK